MSHELFRLRQHIISNPQLASTETLFSVLDFLDARNLGDNLKLMELQQKHLAFVGESALRSASVAYSDDKSIASISISGALSHKATALEAMCGARSYQSILQDVKQVASEDSVETVVLEISSGGGEATGAFEAAREIKSLLADKKLIAFVDSLAASAAYAIASQADEIIMTSDAKVGSIGVVLPLMNYKEKLEQDGVKFDPIFAGKYKVLGHPALEMTEDERAILQENVDNLFNMFTDLVVEGRDITAEDIVELGALTFMGKDAVEKGLADKVMTVSEFQNYLGGSMSKSVLDGVKSNAKEVASTASEVVEANVENQDVAKMAAQMADMQAQLEQLQAANKMKEDALLAAEAALKAEAEAKEKARLDALTEKAESYKTFGIDSAQFAEAAMGVDQAFLDVVMGALDKAVAQVDESMTELGHTTEGVGEVAEDDAVARVNALIGAQSNLK